MTNGQGAIGKIDRAERSPLPDRMVVCDATSEPAALRSVVVASVAGGLMLRLATLVVPHAFFPDEIFQYLEPAHRLVFGHGVITWEYRYGIRSWLLPLVLAGPMWLGGAVAPTDGAYLLLPKLLLLILSLPILWAAWRLGRSITPRHAMVALFVAATWYEAIYFATQALTECVAVAAILPGAALLLERRRLPVAGALLTFGAVLRFQYGPAIAVFGCTALWPHVRRRDWSPLAAMVPGASAVIVCSAMVDVAMGMRPFGWLIENFHQNIGLGRSHAWVSGPFFYPQAIASVWGPWLLPIALLATLGARRYPALLACALTNVAVHSAIAHKEYRYILLSTIMLAVLAAIGTGDGIDWLVDRTSAGRKRLTVIAIGGWATVSLSIACGAEVRGWWSAETPQLRTFTTLRDDPALCGLALEDVQWSGTGGYAYLHRPIPLLAYRQGQERQLMRDAATFNTIVAPGGVALPHGYLRAACLETAPGDPPICTFRRGGGCRHLNSPAEINRQLIRLDR